MIIFQLNFIMVDTISKLAYYFKNEEKNFFDVTSTGKHLRCQTEKDEKNDHKGRVPVFLIFPPPNLLINCLLVESKNIIVDVVSGLYCVQTVEQ